MTTRPEGSDSGGYDAIDPPDSEAWEQFTPWRPGDASTSRSADESSVQERDGFKWTEDQPTMFHPGDRVRNVRPVGGFLGGAVQAGTFGEVVSMRAGLFDLHVTVKFEGGYTEEISPADIEYKGWF
jgi:hypothetical protein